MKLELMLRWRFDGDGEPWNIDPLLFVLLEEIRQGSNLNHAARAAGVSYRHAWGLLREWEQRVGKPVISARQGRGAQLTELGEALLEMAAEVEQGLAPELERAATETAAQLEQLLDPQRHSLAIASSHSAEVIALRDQLSADHRVIMDLTGSEHALQRYRRGDADIAGFHLPMGILGRTVAALLINLLDARRDRIWLLERRTLGLVSRPDQCVRSLEQLAAGDWRFVNRQPGSGTRLVLDGLLGSAGIAPGDIRGYAHEEYTHTAVAAMIASDSADAGIATSECAAAMGLAFEPLCDERFYLVLSGTADSSLRRQLDAFCAAHCARDDALRADEYTPTVAALKRIHGAGFWKQAAPRVASRS